MTVIDSQNNIKMCFIYISLFFIYSLIIKIIFVTFTYTDKMRKAKYQQLSVLE